MMSERERIRRWRVMWHTRLFFTIGLILAVWNWLSLLSALWWSDITRGAAASLTLWYIMAQVATLWLLWQWLGPRMRERKGIAGDGAKDDRIQHDA